LLLPACALLAASPDLDLFAPALIQHRTVTHSVGAVVLVTVLTAAVCWLAGRVSWRVTLTCGAAYGSHILLDWLGRDPTPPFGIQALWPFTREWYISPLALFPATERRDFLTAPSLATNAKAVLVDIAIMGSLVGILWLTRRARPQSQGPS
jgi:inner membrane protein